MLTLGALALLATTMVNMLRISGSVGETMLRSKSGIAAVSIATSLIEESQRKLFDAACTDSAINTLNTLTSPSSLGASSSEQYPNINDFDDYNNLKIKYFLQLPDTLFVNCKVVYIDPNYPDRISSSKTWHKKLTINVSSPSMQDDTVKMEYIYSYWYFR